jgi:cysteine-rich PDZ-binding protein
MVCDDCTKQLSTISAPDPWKQGSSSGGPGRLVNENKLLRKGIRSNPYSNSCKICKLKCQQNNAIYCTICAYAKGLCSICGKVVQDTRMYKMSEGGNGWHTVRDRDEKSFKSPDQIAREESQKELLEFLASSGSVGRMPTRGMMEAAGKKELAATLTLALTPNP